MEAVNGDSLGEDKGGPPPPSPLTGCYLLVVIGEPHSEEHKDIILQKVAKGLLSWDSNECLVDLEKELAVIIEQGLDGEEARYGERLIQFASENLVTEILIHPAVSTLSQCVRNLLSSFTRHRHIIHAGYTFQGNGSWALQDGTFSYSDFAEAFQEIEVQRVIHAYENGISIDLHCTPEGDWTRLPKEYFTKSCKVRVNPTDVLTTGSPSISRFTKYLEPFLVPTVLEDILESSDVVGNIRFSRPTLYVFPGGQGDAALFGINGFNMLLDGGYSRKACFWDFVRHLDRLDAVLMTRLNNSSVSGVSSVLKRKKQGAVYPQVGHFFCNIHERKSLLSPDGDKDKDPLIISLIEEGQNIIQDLRHLNLSPQSCYRESDPIILYHKVGHGTLNMFVLSPDRNSREVREFLQKWNQNDSKLFSGTKVGKEFSLPLQNLVSICALLVWQPANPNDTITRILYPGSTPQKKIFEGLDRLKSLEYMKHPICMVKSIIPVKKSKQDIIEKLTARETKAPIIISEKKTENKQHLIEDSMKNGEMNGDVINRDKQVKKSDSLESDKEKRVKKIEDVKKAEESRKTENGEKKVVENGEKTKPKPKPSESKPKIRGENQQKKKAAPTEKKGPPTPKKTIEISTNGEVKEKERKIAHKPSPNATPAKSTKDANNRKVIENKKAPLRKEAVPKQAPSAEAKPKVERKPISRRPKAAKGPPSPIKKMTNGIQKPDSLSKRGKLDKEGTTDSSTVSTPSADQESILKKDISKLTPEEIQQLKDNELEELKEEQAAIKEIEAVFRKGEGEVAESEPGVRKIKEISIDDNLDTEEYLIIEKEEIEHDSLDQETKEDEMQKLVRDSEESEKQRKLSAEEDKLQEQKPSHIEETTNIQEATATKLSDEDIDSKKQQAASPDEKGGSGTDKKEGLEEEIKEIIESQPEEKVSANVESGATTTAPTLPEDERITLDEIKEDNGQVIEEKHVKEETKEKEVPIIQLPPKSQQQDSPSKQPPVVGIPLDKQKHVRDIVKTPDEVADLPVHEEADYHEFHRDEKKGIEVGKQDKDLDKERSEKGAVSPKKDEDTTGEKTTEISKDNAEHHVEHDKKDVKEEKEQVVVETQPPKDIAAVKQSESDIKIKDPVIQAVGSLATVEAEKSDILEKADVETKEKSDQDNNLFSQKEKLKESMDDEWVVITKEEEHIPEVAQEIVETSEGRQANTIDAERQLDDTEDLQHALKDKIVSDFIAKEVEQELSQLNKGQVHKDTDTDTEEDHVSNDIRKEDEIEDRLESDKEDIKALIEEADRKTVDDKTREKTSEKENEETIKLAKEVMQASSALNEKVSAIKESKEDIAAIDNKLQELKKEVIVPVEELNVDKVGKDLTKIEEPQTDIKQKLKEIVKIDDKLNELKSLSGEPITGTNEVKVEKSTRSPEHAESVVLSDSSPEEDGPRIFKDLDIDKSELGRKSPAEREEDVKKIVVSVAEVLKSEAPLEEFQGKVPFTQELRETHITTQDSPVLETKIIKTDDIPPIPEESLEEEMKPEKIEKDVKETTDVSLPGDVTATDDNLEKDDESSTVHRMLVTASSEDGGEEIEICPAGTITFSKSSESSGRSSPEPSQKTPSQKSSIVETLSDTLTTVKQLTEKNMEAETRDLEEVEKIEPKEIQKQVVQSKEEVDKAPAEKSKTSVRIDVTKDKHDDIATAHGTDLKTTSEKNDHVDATQKVAGLNDKTTQEEIETSDVAAGSSDGVKERVEKQIVGELHTAKESVAPTEEPVEVTSKIKDAPATIITEAVVKTDSILPKVEEVRKDAEHITSQSIAKLDDSVHIIDSQSELKQDVSKLPVEKTSEMTKAEEDSDAQPSSQRRESIIEKAQEFLDKSEEALQDVFASIGTKVHSILDDLVHTESDSKIKHESTDDSNGKSSSLSQDIDISLTPSTKSASEVKELNDNILSKDAAHKQDDTKATESTAKENVEKASSERKSSVIETAEEFMEKCEKTLESGFSAIGETAKSVLHDIGEPLQPKVEGIELKEVKEDIESKKEATKVLAIDEGKLKTEHQEESSLPKAGVEQKAIIEKDLVERRGSIIEAAEEFIEKSENTLESVLSTLGGAAMSALHDILPEEKIRTTEHSTEKTEIEKDQPYQELEKTQQFDKEVSIDSAKTLGEGKALGLDQKIKESSESKQFDNEETSDGIKNDSSKRRGSIIEEIIGKSEKTVGGAVQSAIHHLLPEEQAKAPESNADKSDDAIRSKEIEKSVQLEKELKSGTEKVTSEFEEPKKAKDAKDKSDEDKTDTLEKDSSERRGSILAATEEFIEKSEKKLESVFSAIGDTTKSVLHGVLPGDESNKAFEPTPIKTDALGEAKKDPLADEGKPVHCEEAKQSKTTGTVGSNEFISDLPKKESISSEKKTLVDEFKVDKNTIEKEKRQIDEEVDQLRRSYEDLSKLAESVPFEKCHPSDEFKIDKETIKEEEKEIDDQVTHVSEAIVKVSDLAQSIPFEKCVKLDENKDVSKSNTMTVAEEFKIDKETIRKEERPIEEEVEELRHNYEDLSKITESASFEKCHPFDQYKVGSESIAKDEKEIENQVMHVSESVQEVSHLAKSIPFETCHPLVEDHKASSTTEKSYEFKVDKDATEKEKQHTDERSDELFTCDFKVDKTTLQKEEKEIDNQVMHVSETVEKLSDLAKSVSFEKCPPQNDEFKVDKAAIEKEEKQIEGEVSHIKETSDSLSKLNKSISFDKCKPTDEFKVEKDVKQIDEEVDQLEKSYEDLSKLTQSVSLDKCKFADEFKIGRKDSQEKDERHMGDVVEEIRRSCEDLSKLTDGILFDKCQPPPRDFTILDSNKAEHLSSDEKKYKEKVDFSIDKDSLKTDEIPPSKASVVLDEQPSSSQTEKCEKESMEKTSFDKDTSLKINQTESKKLSISDVEISIKTEIDHKDASRSFLDNERAVICDSTDAKVFSAPSGDSIVVSQDGSSIQTSAETEAKSDISSPDMESSSGKATPPTVPISPIAKDIKKLDSGLSEQTETDEEDLSTKSQVAYSQSDLDELDMKMDPMSMSFYGALPEGQFQGGEPVAATYLYEITKAKYTKDIRVEDDDDDDEEDVRGAEMNLMTAGFIGELPSSSTESKRDDGTEKDPVDSWGKPLRLPAPTYQYEATKAKFSSQSEEIDLMTSSFIGELPSSSQIKEKEEDPMTTSVYFDDSSYDPIASWGKPLGLPSPAPPNNNEKGTPKKERRLPAYVSAKNKLNDDKKRPESPSKLKAKKVNPVYVDLTYVPHHGNHYYSYVDFFRRIRARYYVFSGLEPSRQVYDALLEAKQTWEDKELEVTIIPTYDTDILGYWVAENEELLSKFKVDLAPSASRCTINLQDHETSCSAYRLEF